MYGPVRVSSETDPVESFPELICHVNRLSSTRCACTVRCHLVNSIVPKNVVWANSVRWGNLDTYIDSYLLAICPSTGNPAHPLVLHFSMRPY